MSPRWEGTGPVFRLDGWGGRTWTLALDGPQPGLLAEDGAIGPLLALDSVAAVGRSSSQALSGSTLVGYECRAGKVQATYAPLGWGGLNVRATWSLAGEQDVDLEVQISASSVGQLRTVEVWVSSRWQSQRQFWGPDRIDLRDPRSAALILDGREPRLADFASATPLMTGQARSKAVQTFYETLLPPTPDRPYRYLELAHAEDVTRRIIWSDRIIEATRYDLFGHDLEKGVIVRGRLRGTWILADAVLERSRISEREFLGEPLPLGT